MAAKKKATGKKKVLAEKTGAKKATKKKTTKEKKTEKSRTPGAKTSMKNRATTSSSMAPCPVCDTEYSLADREVGERFNCMDGCLTLLQVKSLDPPKLVRAS